MKIEVLREHHEAPDYAQRLALLAGGLNRFGQPNYRWCWGWSRLSMIGGEFINRTPDGKVWSRFVGMREVPKYEPYARWHLESWVPAETYGSPRMWALTTRETVYGGTTPVSVAALGAYPQFGDWEHVLTLDQPCARCIRLKLHQKCEHRTFQQLTCEIAFRMARALEFSRSLDEAKRREGIRKREEWEALQDDKAIDEVLGADPVQIPQRRKLYLENCIVPKLEKAMVNAAKRKQQGYNPTQSYKTSIGGIDLHRPHVVKQLTK